MGVNSSVVGRGRRLAAFADKDSCPNPILYPRRRLLGAPPHSGGVYSHALFPVYSPYFGYGTIENP